ncbi:hypothetical protein GTA08_BOTSDO08829 [Neofusicoccum parvum]|uniref:Uncharacterized protein n=1 Tax=Neofusicoccum parvum TaxID=310453 RepID=A0ACB5SCX3_9PEZI|nr:hypothetical protein GTA08_BOTSDO08829 [Neofusicoccum parvum]
MDEIKSNQRLSFTEVLREEFNAELFHAGDVFLQNGIMQETVRTKLTRSLPKFTAALSEEASDALARVLPSGKEWQDTVATHLGIVCGADGACHAITK